MLGYSCLFNQRNYDTEQKYPPVPVYIPFYLQELGASNFTLGMSASRTIPLNLN